MRSIRHGLQARLLGSLVLSTGAALLTVAGMVRWSTTAEFERYVQQNHAEMQQVARTLAVETGKRVVVANASGQVFLDSSNELLGERVDPALPRLALAGGPTGPVAGGPAGPGVVLVQTSGGAPPPLPATAPPTEEDVFLGAFGRSLVVGVLVGGAVALGLAVAFARRIVQPIGALTLAARRMASGDLEQRVVVGSRDEIGELGQAFNALAAGLARTERLRRTLVADVAHELRTPLTNLRGYLEALCDGVAEPRPEVIRSLLDEAVLLGQIVEDLQDLALGDAGQLTLHREVADVNALVRSAVRAVQHQAARQAVTVCASELAEPVRVWVDVRRVGQILRNLLANALAYTPAGGSITVGMHVHGQRLMVLVRDSGPGIAAEHIPNVFERFYRVDGSRSRATGGAGIGLAVVKQLVEAHGGTVAVASVPGAGATFSFSVPLAAPPAAAASCTLAGRS